LFALVSAGAIAARELMQSIAVPERSFAGWLLLRAGLVNDAADRGTCRNIPNSTIGRLRSDYVRVANYLATHTRADERILVGLDRHDKIFLNPVTLYFAVDRLPGTHWHQFDPGLQTRADIQADIIADLQRNAVRWVVRDASFGNINEPNESAQSSGVTLLDEYLQRHYRVVASAGLVEVWLSNPDRPTRLSPPATCEASALE
jgi:hypothetical protein